MNPALKDMLEAYRPETPADYQNAAREVVQEIALLGLWRGGFFEHAAFYGGTALRIFHGLRRFSEDLDFTLVDPGDGTRQDRYLPGVATEIPLQGVLGGLVVTRAALGASCGAGRSCGKDRLASCRPVDFLGVSRRDGWL